MSNLPPPSVIYIPVFLIALATVLIYFIVKKISKARRLRRESELIPSTQTGLPPVVQSDIQQ